jgi:hypothetical protein
LVVEGARPIYVEDSFADLDALKDSPWRYEVITADRAAQLVRENDYLIRL